MSSQVEESAARGSYGRRSFPGLSFSYAYLPPHQEESRTGPGQVGVAFSAHESVAFRSGRMRGTASYPGGSVIYSGAEPIVWSSVREPTEALEMYPDPSVVGRVSGAVTGGWPLERAVIGAQDPVVVGAASVLRRAHVTGGYLSDMLASTLAHRLVARVFSEYGGRRYLSLGVQSGHTVLSHRHLRTVNEFIEAELGGEITLDGLAAQVHLSPFHFARAFKAAVGMAPYQYVTSRRMDRSRLLLRTTRSPVERVAAEVGFTNLSHFRRVFTAHVGATPMEYRDHLLARAGS